MTGPPSGPDPDRLHPLDAAPGVVFLAPLAAGRENVEVGPYTYYDDATAEAAEAFFEHNVLYHFPFHGDRLKIGPFCAIARGARFIMNGATHAMSGFSTFPFNIFGGGWEDGFDPATWVAENRGDTVVGADVWIGYQALILPGVTIGPGAIIAAQSVVSADVPPYTVVGGNPARPLRQRFDQATTARLMALSWWDWPLDKISRNLNAIRGNDLAALEAAE